MVRVAIALIIPTNNKNNIHLEVLSNVAKKLLDPHLRETLKTERDKTKILALLQVKEEVTALESETYKGYVLAITACPAGVADTYMAAKKLKTKPNSSVMLLKLKSRGQMVLKIN